MEFKEKSSNVPYIRGRKYFMKLRQHNREVKR